MTYTPADSSLQLSVNGEHNNKLSPDELLAEIRVPVPGPGVHCAFEKLRIRRAIDFPLANLAVLLETEPDHPVRRLEMVVSALGARPRKVTLDSLTKGKSADELVEVVATHAFEACKPLTNIAADPDWRRQMLSVLARRAMERVNRGVQPGGALTL